MQRANQVTESQQPSIFKVLHQRTTITSTVPSRLAAAFVPS